MRSMAPLVAPSVDAVRLAGAHVLARSRVERMAVRAPSLGVTRGLAAVPWNRGSGAWPSIQPVYEDEPHRFPELVSETLKVPKFAASSASLVRIETPRQFYGVLKNKIAQARHRIFISTLYIGKEERELVGYLRRALAQNPGLQLTLVMDAMRATRESPKGMSSASLLASLERLFPDQVDIRLYATPLLRPDSPKARLVGKRFNEGFGLQHMKVYGFDDDVIMSGANLSRDYFTRRKDRYMLIRGQRMLADYMHSLVLLVCRFSFALRWEGSVQLLDALRAEVHSSDDDGEAVTAGYHAPFRLVWDGGACLLSTEDTDGTICAACLLPPSFEFPERNWVPMATHAVRDFTERWYERTQEAHERAAASAARPADTCIVPLLQMGQLRITQESDMIPLLSEYVAALRPRRRPAAAARMTTPPHTMVDLTSGYFSLSGVYRSFVLSEQLHAHAAQPDRTAVGFRLVAASPEANGFFGSKGISGRIPDAYTYLEKQFWDEVVARGLDRPLFPRHAHAADAGRGEPVQQSGQPIVELREWRKYGWTYHEKGVWITPPTYLRDAHPTTTLIGSSNYGARSEHFDLECTLLITTEAESLRRVLQREVDDMRDDARDVMSADAFQSQDRSVGRVTKLLTHIVKRML
ncbi:CDP-diacylglycerol--glycerol-3-phosphate 1-phosphatidyltransferase [Malassezia sp. CBS 17886]|nr:CDP-diacylglycerol--glycerol-3-phosphate 1-phosphatidyltransferase [Malassezia sp. CBS 17886]